MKLKKYKLSPKIQHHLGLASKLVAKYWLVVLLLIFVTMVIIAKTSGVRYASALQQSRAELQTLQDHIRNVLPPSRIELGQQDLSIDYLLQQTNPENSKLPQVSTPSIAMTFINLLPRVNYPYSAYHEIYNVRSEAKQLFNYQYQVFYAMGSVLEYNPRAEFADKTLNEDEIKLRINSSRTGLSAAYDSLQKIKKGPNDENRDEMATAIKTLQQQLEDFDKNRNVEAWAKRVDEAQKKIVSNRQSYWNKATEKLYGTISSVNQGLATIENALLN